jgi:hypothetical protein
MAGAFDETELSARKHAGDAFPDVGGADWVRYAVHMESGLSDCSELGVKGFKTSVYAAAR